MLFRSLTAVCAYAFEERETAALPGAAGAAFALVRPVLDSSRRKAENGSVGGSRPKANQKQTQANERKRKQSLSEGEKETEKEKEKETEKEGENECSLPPAPLPGGQGAAEAFGDVFGPELEGAARDWLRYKAERGQAYGDTGLLALRDRLAGAAAKYGEAAVTAVVRESMASGYAGLAWSRLETAGAGTPERRAGEDLSWMKPYL